MSLEYIRQYYGVPAKRGAPVKYKGQAGMVTGASGPHVQIRLLGENHTRPYHPKDEDVEWPEKPRTE
jgi:hypothetical protein